MRAKCEFCYFYSDCGTKRVCAHFAPIEYTLIDEEMERKTMDTYIEAERQNFYERFWEMLYEEDQLQDYFG